MTDLRLGHLYRETNHWTASNRWWSNLGFSFAEQWGAHIVTTTDPDGRTYNLELEDSNT
jgi:hypothetical protein